MVRVWGVVGREEGEGERGRRIELCLSYARK